MPGDDSIRIKDYQIHQPPLGEGAFGQVFRATYRGISDRALKIFRPGAVDLGTMARELEKLSKVAEHQGIVTLHDFDLLHDVPYYAMGLHADQNSDGSWETRTLSRLCGHVDHREGWRLIREIADALAYLHRHQIVHCDVKPSNILLTDETPFHIKICDFGQSRGLASEGFQPVGTPLYASPEQLRNPRDSADGKGFRWDVYSFGVVAYKLLTGQLPRLQAVAEAEQNGFDPESTVQEASLEATVAEGTNLFDGDRLATLVEAVEDIEWPSDYYVPSIRKDLIEQCLSLDPYERPADMREVWGRIQEIDQHSVVKRARRLNAIFATMLVIALWASGLAFIQARKARAAEVVTALAYEESEKSANAAVDLMLLFVQELNRGELSGESAERLFAIVADNSATFLQSRSRDRQTSTQILWLSAHTATLTGDRALKKGDLETAQKQFQSAYDIRSRLADDVNSPEDLPLLAARDLMQIGRIHERQGKYSEAITTYLEALEWLKQTAPSDGVFPVQQITEMTGGYSAAAKVYHLRGDSKAAAATLEEILKILRQCMEKGPSADTPSYALETIRILRLKGEIHLQSGNLKDASQTYQDILELSEAQRSGPRSVAGEALLAHVAAMHALGRIQLEQGQLDAALVLFQREIAHRETSSRIRPYNAEESLALAEAYAFASRCLDASNPTSRQLAIAYLEQAVLLIGNLPPETRNREDVQARLLSSSDQLNRLKPQDG